MVKKEVKDLQDWAAVQKLKKQNMNISEISKALGMSRTTVYNRNIKILVKIDAIKRV